MWHRPCVDLCCGNQCSGNNLLRVLWSPARAPCSKHVFVVVGVVVVIVIVVVIIVNLIVDVVVV